MRVYGNPLNLERNIYLLSMVTVYEGLMGQTHCCVRLRSRRAHLKRQRIPLVRDPAPLDPFFWVQRDLFSCGPLD